jgi:sulfur transfer protein SufE
MKKRLLGLFAVCVTALIAGAAAASEPVPDHYPGRLLVRFSARTSEASAASIAQSINGILGPRVGHTAYRIVTLNPGQNGYAAMADVEGSAWRGLCSAGGVDDIEYDRRVAPADTPNDPSYGKQWHLPKIACPAAWSVTHGSSSVIIAILDTGVDSTHADLSSKIVSGWDVYDNGSNTADVYGHGTAVAGTAGAATDNDTGVAGVAWNCMIMPVRITDTSGYAYSSTASEGLAWAQDHGARVANLSFAFADDPIVEAAAESFYNNGGAVTVAAGNSSTVDTNPDNPYEIVVSGTDSNDKIASWSNTGNNIDVSAPGVNIYTTCKGGSYANWSGTSFSAPITAGIAALAIAVAPSLTGAQIKQIICNSADLVQGSTGWNETYGWGRVDAAKAVALAENDETPSVSFTSPSNGSTVSGTVSIVVSASSTVGVSSVQLEKDGTLVSTMTSSPYSYSYNSTADSNGSHTFTATVCDSAGNHSSAGLTLTVSNTDTTPPTVSFTSPSENSQVSGTVTADISASDNVGVASVVVKKDGVLVATLTSSPYSWSYDTTEDANGSHTLTATAYDAAGNSATATLNLTVDNPDTTPPTVNFTAPSNGATVSGSVSVAISASDNVGVVSVKLTKDGAAVASWTSGPYAYSWDTTKDSNGSHVLVATAADAAGNKSTATVTVTVSNADTTPPTISFTSPASGATVVGTVPISMSASDNVGVASVKLTKDGVLVATLTAAPYTWSYNSKLDANGSHSFAATAYDAAGNHASASLSVNVSNADTTPPTVSFTSPASGATVVGTVPISMSASDNVGVASVKLTKDGVLVATLTAAPYTWSYNSALDANGSHSFVATAYDAAGNHSAAGLTVKVSNPVPPKVTLVSPQSGGASGEVTIHATVSDKLPVVRVSILVDGEVFQTFNMAPYVATYRPTKGKHTIQAMAVDSQGTVGYSQIVTITR